jgi:hypothetical protein
MMNPPQSLEDLIAYLKQHPRVRCTMPGGDEDERQFLRFANGGFWWTDPTGGRDKHTPMGCGQTSIFFTPVGFTIEKFGVKVAFDYLPDEVW